MNKGLCVAGVCGALLLPAVSFAATPAAPAASVATLQKAIHSELVGYLQARGKIEHISAASASISLRGQAANINVAAGTTRFGGGPRISPSTLFQIGSNTKAFTATVILQLEAEHKLSIDDKLGKWLPQYPQWKNITIHQLLDMTSGIQTYDNVQPFQKVYAKAPKVDYTPAQLIAYAAKLPLEPGWVYSNTNYELAQLIIEKVTGHSYATEIEQRIIKPLGLEHTFYNGAITPPSITDQMPAGYFFSTDPDNAGLKPLYGKDVRGLSLSWAQAAGAIIATPEDLTRWVRALYQGKILQPKQRAELLTLVGNDNGEPIAKTSSAHPRGFGLGVGQRYTPQYGGMVWYYEGETLGYRVMYMWVPETDTVIAVGLNSQPDSANDEIGKLTESIYDILIKHHAVGGNASAATKGSG